MRSYWRARNDQAKKIRGRFYWRFTEKNLFALFAPWREGDFHAKPLRSQRMLGLSGGQEILEFLKKLYLDNGPAFGSQHLAQIIASLSIAPIPVYKYHLFQLVGRITIKDGQKPGEGIIHPLQPPVLLEPSMYKKGLRLHLVMEILP